MSKDKLYQLIIGILTLWGGFVGKALWDYSARITAIETEMKITKEWRQARESRGTSGRTR